MDRKLAIVYRTRGSSKSKDAVVSPFGLVQRGPILYLFVSFDGFSDSRTLALHRILDAQLKDERVNRPVGFSLDKSLNEGIFDFGSGRTIKLLALFDEDASIHLEESRLSLDQTLSKARDGRVRVTATVAETPQIVWWLLGFGEQVEVLRPLRMRHRLARTAREMAALYRNH